MHLTGKSKPSGWSEIFIMFHECDRELHNDNHKDDNDDVYEGGIK